MKKFLEKYSYQCVTLFVNQIAIALFAISLAFAAGMAKNDTLKIVTSIFLMLKLKLQYSGHLMLRSNSLEKTLMLGKIENKRRRGNRE